MCKVKFDSLVKIETKVEFVIQCINWHLEIKCIDPSCTQRIVKHTYLEIEVINWENIRKRWKFFYKYGCDIKVRSSKGILKW